MGFGDTNYWYMVNELKKKYKMKTEEAENILREGAEIFSTIYDGKYKGSFVSLVNHEIFIPYHSRMYFKIRFEWSGLSAGLNYYDEDPPVDYSKEPYKGKKHKVLSS